MAPFVEHDYYEILGVSNTAPIELIRQNYRRLALERHPDKNKNEPDATAAFQLVCQIINPTPHPKWDFQLIAG